MDLILVTTSSSLARHFGASSPAGVEFRRVSAVDDIVAGGVGPSCIVLLHAPALPDGVAPAILGVRNISQSAIIGIASDEPALAELLGLLPLDIRAYFNSYMADVHYHHLLATMREGLCWFAPALLSAMLEALPKLARRADPPELGQLTAREREIARSVADGMNNKNISRRFGITERTVKAHLTNIYEKLKLPNRLALALRLKGPGVYP